MASGPSRISVSVIPGAGSGESVASRAAAPHTCELGVPEASAVPVAAGVPVPVGVLGVPVAAGELVPVGVSSSSPSQAAAMATRNTAAIRRATRPHGWGHECAAGLTRIGAPFCFKRILGGAQALASGYGGYPEGADPVRGISGGGRLQRAGLLQYSVVPRISPGIRLSRSSKRKRPSFVGRTASCSDERRLL